MALCDDVQPICYATENERTRLWCRDGNGTEHVRVVSTPARWVWGCTERSPPTGMPAHKRKRVEGKSLYATDPCTDFVELSFRGSTPRHADSTSYWYDNKLDNYHSMCARNGTRPCGWSKPQPAKARLMCIDIEAMPGPNMAFPDAQRDSVLQISVVYDVDMFSPGEACEMHLFAVGNIDSPLLQIDEFDPSACTIHSSDTEERMLLSFEAFLKRHQPDIISGWNTNGFDLPYLFDRTVHLLQRPPKYGRDNADMIKRKTQKGNTIVKARGRIFADMLDIWRSQHNERSYKLDDVAASHLGASKAPVQYSQIRQLQMTPEGRNKLGAYCLKDAHLVWRLGKTRKKWSNALEMSHVTFVPLEHLFCRGQQWRVFSLLVHYAYTAKPRIFLPSCPPESNSDFEGAVVISPKPGFYTSCVSTVDFASLYPSIMMAWNMCYTTMRTTLTAEELCLRTTMPLAACRRVISFLGALECQDPRLRKAVQPDAREWHRCGNAEFSRKQNGLLPQILKTLLGNRAVAKKRMKQAKNDVEYNVLNGQQLALKLCANSLYGFTGTSMEVGMLPCPAIASSVTYMGRKLTTATKAMCERKFGVEGVYGDTDSVFFHHRNVGSVQQASTMAERIAEFMNERLPPPLKLEFEKVYKPYLLLAKKRYVGQKYDEGRSPPIMDAKGIEMVRRDNFPLLPQTMKLAVHKLMQCDAKAALQVVADVLIKLRTCTDVPLDCLTISKELTKAPEKYLAKPPHVVVAARVKHNVHDRVQYLVTRGHGGVGDRARHPSEMVSKEVDHEWYAQQLIKSLTRILKPCCSEEELSACMNSGVDRHVIASIDTCPIAQFFEHNINSVWRKRPSRTDSCATRKAKRARQQSLNSFLGI